MTTPKTIKAAMQAKTPVRITVSLNSETPVRRIPVLMGHTNALISDIDSLKCEEHPYTQAEVSELFHRFKALAAAIDQLGDKLRPGDDRSEGDVVSDWRFGDNCFSN